MNKVIERGCEIRWVVQALLELTNLINVVSNTTKTEKGSEYEF